MSSRPSPSVLQVYIFKEGEFLGTDIFAEREIVIGRDPDEADLVLESGQVSRAHAVLTVDGRKITVEDQNSTNGVLVNDEQVESAQITKLDEITIGEFTLKVKLSGKRRPSRRVEDATRQQAAAAPSKKRAAPEPKREAPILARQDSSAPFDPNDLSDFDDIDEREETGRSGPEFRNRLEKVDQNRLGEMLEDMGLSDSDAPAGGLAEMLEGEETRVDPMARKPMFTDTRAPATQLNERAFLDQEETEAGDDEPEPSYDLGSAGSYEDDDLDEEELEELNYVPPYSLAEKLVEEDAAVAAGPRNAPYQLEIVTLKGDSVSDVALLKPGESYYVGPKIGGLRRPKDLPPRVRLAKFKRNGAAAIEFPKDVSGSINRAGSPVPVGKALAQPNRGQLRRGTVGLEMKPGEVLDVVHRGERYHIRYARPPERIQDKRSVRDKITPGRIVTYSGAGSFAAHIAAFIIVWILGVASASKPVAPGDEFVEMTLETELELEQEEPEPEPVVEEEPAPEPEPQAAPEPQPKPKKQPKLRAQKPQKNVKKEQAGGTSAKPAGVLGLLSKRGSSAAPGPASAVASLSNLKASKVPGSKGGFKASGLIGKAPSSGVNLGGGGGGLATKGALSLLKGGKGGAGRIKGGAVSGRVRGMVSKAPPRRIAQSGGTLSRDEIQKVINKNIGQIQRCYERELTKNAGLSGKVTIQWTVGTSGSVTTASQKKSSLPSTDAVNCMIRSIKSWRFPAPRGGPAIVTYPFAFRAVSG